MEKYRLFKELSYRNCIRSGVLCVCLLLLNGCEGFKQEPICANDSMPGPGLFSGPEGVFHIPLPDSWKKSSSEEEKTKDTEEKSTKEACKN